MGFLEHPSRNTQSMKNKSSESSLRSAKELHMRPVKAPFSFWSPRSWSVFVAIGMGGGGACGVLKNDDMPRPRPASAPGQLSLKRIAPKLDAAQLLTLRGGAALRALGKDGKVYGVKSGALAEETSAKIPFQSLVSDEGEGFALSADSGWFLGRKFVARQVKVDGKPKLFSASSRGAHKVIGVTEEKLFASYEGKIEIFSLKAQNIVRSEIDWPLRDEPPLSAGYVAAEKSYWFASAKSFIFLDEDGSNYTQLPNDTKGLGGSVLAHQFKVTKQNVDLRTLPTSGAVLTSEGLFATADLVAGASLSGATTQPGGGDDGIAYDFVSDIKPIADQYCVACHSIRIGGFGPSGIEASWTTHKDTLLDRLGSSPTGNPMPPTPMDAAKKAILVAWLEGEKKAAPVAPAVPVNTPMPVVTTSPSNGAMALPPVELYDIADGSLTLNNMVKEASNVPGAGLPAYPNNVRVVGSAAVDTEGRLTFNFTGQSGTYRVELDAYDENDGQSEVKFSVGNNVVGTATLDLLSDPPGDVGNTVRTFVLSNSVALTNGGAISLGVVKKSATEHGRLVRLRFTPAN